MKFNENSRIKLPSVIHLWRLGYEYLSLKNAVYNPENNIFIDIFKQSITRINPDIEEGDTTRILEEICFLLENEDLGNSFYKLLTQQSGYKIIDFSNFENNNFHVVTELTYQNGDEEFRPDITILINGIPLAFIELKIPNNQDGMLAEIKRSNTRFSNKRLRRFANITQFMVFSNNMEYDNESIEPIAGVFYASPSYTSHDFNYFREEENLDLSLLLQPENEELENFVLTDNNLQIIKNNPEFITNKSPHSPNNRLLTSLFSQERIKFILGYAIAYVKEASGWQQHIMRYPQIFATKAIQTKLAEGVRSGIIWHTQGSGKTALAYYNVKVLTDYFRAEKVIPKFYFIVDRLDLLEQAKKEFTSRGLTVHTIDSKNAFANDIKSTSVIHNLSGKSEITVVNIQKFKDDPDVIKTQDYDVNIQRVYFLDEVHRSYNPKGSFLANLSQSDRNAIKIGLTGTPLLGNDYNSKMLFGDYIHKYYYNASIADGYTLRLIREEIETSYKLTLQEALDEIEVLKGEIDKKLVFSHAKYVKPLLEYIIHDFENSRIRFDDHSIGAMVICDSAEQAKKLYEIFQEKQANQDSKNQVKTAALILHDIATKEERKNWIEEFKEGKIDILFVYNMLLTGFDAKRLKKLYLGRLIKRHNLLQALTRVNRPYKNFRYGFVVDFADIRKEFDATNEAYFKELQAELGDELEHYSHLFKSPEEIKTEIAEIEDVLFRYDTTNAEIFSQQINQIHERDTILVLKKSLENAKSLYNLIRLMGKYELLEKADFQKLNVLYREASNRVDMINLKQRLESGTETGNLLNAALEDIIFSFDKVGEEELVLADELKNTLRRTREALANNFDQVDPQFISLKEELERLFKQKKLSEVKQEQMNQNISSLNRIYEQIKEVNRQNNLLKAKYDQDVKYVRIHKRLLEAGKFAVTERKIYEALRGLKTKADDLILQNTKILNNESYFSQQMIRLLIDQFKNQQKIDINAEMSKYINNLIVKEYISEYNRFSA
ncbi:type I restriction endonuclease subunit R [Nodularia sphaerocarpa]|uniref:type I restriction endonuclease subunit R n=1 Tax=Nodularia sphaerocarpa TaxID=137816 RepID=UPI001EFA2F72|nr:type I restriction endonuclease [Nodularia sphaerocarpa]MDB9375201.1 DEAD/DEAH box helicase family protein [Nodularia sphaerocarpa CS-585]MDB9378679.1 DEAD/DEAH box helicase family protein [Nodularia sphaerocarpa CS-585A2]ULP71475.1 Type-1 restriction enzyme R protein [Nodularia sphaerocarpa UHCC 0038]